MSTVRPGGTLALVGGDELSEGCSFDVGLLEASGGHEVVLLPTAAAYEHPDRILARAQAWLGPMGARVRALPVLGRPHALDPANVDALAEARFVYLVGSSAMHLRSVLKDTPLWEALLAAYDAGAVVAASSAAAMALCDPMVDPRGGAFTLGLGLVEQLAAITEYDTWSPERARRTFELAGAGLTLVGIPRRTALVHAVDGAWTVQGVGDVTVQHAGETGGVELL